jgi:LysR family transcriptional regulator, hydrogen peroxide-inducible genes activator
MDRPSVRQLEYAVAVADELHFGRAARRSAVTQPALSTQIKELESLLGVRLFERGRRRVLLTAAGELVIARARRALQALDEVVAAADTAREPLCGPLRLGVIPTLAPYLLPETLPAVRAAHPRLRLFLFEDKTERLLEQLDRGALDLALLALPVDDERLETLDLFEERFVLAVPAGHPLARGRRRLRQADLRDESVLLLEDGHCLRDQALEVCRRSGARESVETRASSLTTLVQMVANGLGVTLLPASSVPVEVRHGGEIAVREFAPPPPTRRVGLAWRRSSAREDEFRELAELLRPHAPATARLAAHSSRGRRR